MNNWTAHMLLNSATFLLCIAQHPQHLIFTLTTSHILYYIEVITMEKTKMYHKVAKNVRTLNEFTYKLKTNSPSSLGVIVTRYVEYVPWHNIEFAQIYNDPMLN